MATWLLLILALLPLAGQQVGAQSADFSRALHTESVKEQIRSLYMNMDVPEMAPRGDSASGLLNVSLSIGRLVQFRDQVLEASVTLELRWRHRFLDLLKEDLQYVPLNRQNLWTPQFAYVNALAVKEDQNSLYLHLADGDRAVVYRLWYRVSVKCDVPSIRNPLGDHLCTLLLEETHPRNSRSIRAALSVRHRLNCTSLLDGRRSLVYRVSELTDLSRASTGGLRLSAQVCVRSDLLGAGSPLLRQCAMSGLLTLLSLSTLLMLQDCPSARIWLNLLVLHCLIQIWMPLQTLTVLDAWYAVACLASLSCLLVAASDAAHGRCSTGGCFCCCLCDGRAGSAEGDPSGVVDDDDDELDDLKGADGGDANRNGGSMAFRSAYAKEPRSPSAAAAAIVLSDSSDHLDLFSGAGIDGRSSQSRKDRGHQRRQRGAAGRRQRRRRRSSRCQRLCCRLLRASLPLAWVAFAAAYWAVLSVTAPLCETLLPDCHSYKD